jgi:hypothetical protein
MLCADMIEIQWSENAGRKRHAVALLEDISPSGVCLQTESAIPLGAEVWWGTLDQWFGGVVRHCSYREIGYFIGIEFSPGCKWSEEAFQPQHLLDVQELAEAVYGVNPKAIKRQSRVTIQ